MPNGQRLAVAALALFLAPGIWALTIALGYMLATHGLRLTEGALWIAGESFRGLLILSLASTLPALLALIARRRLTVAGLMMWSGLCGGIELAIWLLFVQPPDATSVLSFDTAFRIAIGIAFCFVNAGLFAQMAAVARWPAATAVTPPPRPSS